MLVAKYTANASGVVPTLPSEYVYVINEVENNGVYTVEITSDTDFTSCSFMGKSQLLTIEYLKVTSNVTSMHNMFMQCTELTTIEGISEWDTSNVTNMYGLFYRCHKLAELDLSSWNTGNVTSMSFMLFECSSLSEDSIATIQNWDTRKVSTMVAVFQSCQKLTQLDLRGWNVSNTTDMNALFHNCQSLTSVDLTGWNTSKLLDTHSMFWNNRSLAEIRGIENFNVSNITNFNNMFDQCLVLAKLDVTNWRLCTDKSKMISMNQVFYRCSTLTSIPGIEDWDTSRVVSMSRMFCNCVGLLSLDLENWNTSCTTSMDQIFQNCRSLTSLNLRNWDTTKLLGLSNIFNGCTQLTRLDVGGWYTAHMTTLLGVFESCTNLVNLDMTNWGLNQSTDISLGLGTCTSLKRLRCNNVLVVNSAVEDLVTRTAEDPSYIITENLSGLNISSLSAKNWQVTQLGRTVTRFIYDRTICASPVPAFRQPYEDYFCEDTVLSNNRVLRVVKSFDDSLPSRMHLGYRTSTPANRHRAESVIEVLEINTIESPIQTEVFRNCYNLRKIDKSVVVRNASSISCAFENCYKLECIDTSNWDTRNTVTFAYLFSNCYSLKSLDISNLDTSNCTRLDCTFQSCTSLVSLDLSTMDTSKVTGLNSTFSGSTSLKYLDVSTWDTSKVTNMDYTFNSCFLLETLDLGSWDTSEVTSMYGTFLQCRALKTLDISNFDMTSVTNTNLFISFDTQLRDIGLVHSDIDTINLVGSCLDRQGYNVNLHVGDHINRAEYTGTSSPLITYRSNTTDVYLNSPLLRGDKLVVIDGRLYHYHTRLETILNGSEHWELHAQSSNTSIYRTGANSYPLAVPISDVICDKYVGLANYEAVSITEDCYMSALQEGIFLSVLNTRGINSVEDFKLWLQDNPVKVGYQLQDPYYEELDIAPELSLLANQDLSIASDMPARLSLEPLVLKTMYLSPSTKYSVQFVSSQASVIDIDLGGTLILDKQINAGLNRIVMVTPATITKPELRISGYGAQIVDLVISTATSNVDYFRGMASTFEDSYVPISLLDTKAIWRNEGEAFNYASGLVVEGLNGKLVTLVNHNDFDVTMHVNSDGIVGTEGTLDSSILLEAGSVQLFSFSDNKEFRLITTEELGNAGTPSKVLILDGDFLGGRIPTFEDAYNRGGTTAVDITVASNLHNFGKRGRI